MSTHQHKPAPKRAIAEQALQAAGQMTRGQLIAASEGTDRSVSTWLTHWQGRGCVAPAGFEAKAKTHGGPSRLIWKWVKT